MSSISFAEPSTIVRTRGMFTIALSTYVADLEIVGAIGMGVVTAEAFLAGVASVPEPYTDADWGGWFMWRSFAHRYEVKGGESSLLASWSIEVDSKAMRKVTTNEVMVVVVESHVGAIRVADCTRNLIKLS